MFKSLLEKIKMYTSLLSYLLHCKLDDMEMALSTAELEYSGAGRNDHPIIYDRYAVYHN